MTFHSPSGAGPGRTGTATYEIRVAGHLDDHWAVTLGDFALVRLDDGTTSLTGPVTDQAYLHGVLARIRDLGVPLLTLRTLDCAGTDSLSSAVGTESGPGSEPSTAKLLFAHAGRVLPGCSQGFPDVQDARVATDGRS